MTKLQNAVTKKPIEIDFCFDMLRSGILIGKKGLQIELATGLFVFHAFGVADIASKKVLRGMYAASGGYDCITADSPDYHCIANRIGAIAGLFDKLNKIKPKCIAKWIDVAEGSAAIECIVAELKDFQLTSMDHVIQFFTGLSRKARTQAKEAANDSAVLEFRRRTADNPNAIHIEQKHIHVDIDRNASTDEIQAVIMELMALLAKRNLKSA